MVFVVPESGDMHRPEIQPLLENQSVAHVEQVQFQDGITNFEFV